MITETMETSSESFVLSHDSEYELRIVEASSSVEEEIGVISVRIVDDGNEETNNFTITEEFLNDSEHDNFEVQTIIGCDLLKEEGEPTVVDNKSEATNGLGRIKSRIEKSTEKLPQFPPKDVLAAIARLTNCMTDVTYRSCIFCDYIDRVSKLSLAKHVQRAHKDKTSNWCSRCNKQIASSHVRHRFVECIMTRCPFCKGKHLKLFRKNDDYQIHINHLKMHCLDLFFSSSKSSQSKPDPDGNVEIEDTSIMQSCADPEIDDCENNLDASYFQVCDNAEEVVPMNGGTVVRVTRSMKKSKANMVPPPPRDDDYVNSDENISLNKVPRFHASVTEPQHFPQYPWHLVAAAVRQAEELFYGNRRCLICFGLANDAKDLGLHMLKNHARTTNGKWCYVCNRLVFGLFEHLQTHKNEMLKCSLCTISCTNFVDLRSHLLDHATSHLTPGCRIMPKWFLCTECTKAFPEESQLKNHLQEH